MSNDDSIDVDIRRVCAILESIARNYPSDSPESLAISDAARAYQAVKLTGGLMRAYKKLYDALGGELTDEMKADLLRHGIDPDEMSTDTESGD